MTRRTRARRSSFCRAPVTRTSTRSHRAPTVTASWGGSKRSSHRPSALQEPLEPSEEVLGARPLGAVALARRRRGDDGPIGIDLCSLELGRKLLERVQENNPRAHSLARFPLDACDSAKAQQGMAAQAEEIVVDADTGHPEGLLPDRGDVFLGVA